MRIWIALLVTPILALTDQSIALSTVSWACANQHVLAIHAIHATFLVVTIVATLGAAWVLMGTARTRNDDAYSARRHFVTALATASGVFSTLVIVALWYPTWVIAPCFA